MKVNKKMLIGTSVISMALLMVFIFNFRYFNRSSSIGQNSAYDVGMTTTVEMAVAEESKAKMDLNNRATDSLKIITNVYVSLETLEFDTSIETLNHLIQKYNGYIEDSNIHHNNYIHNKALKDANYTTRIPMEKMDGFIEEAHRIGNIISQNISKQDITKQYQDTESRLNVLKIKEERILNLLAKAEKIEDIITIENQLSDIIYQKESLSQNILNMDDKVSYSTISIDLSEVEKLTNGVTKETSFGTKVIHAINDSLYFFKVAIEKFVITLIYAIPYLLILGVIFLVVYKYIRKKKE